MAGIGEAPGLINSIEVVALLLIMLIIDSRRSGIDDLFGIENLTNITTVKKHVPAITRIGAGLSILISVMDMFILNPRITDHLIGNIRPRFVSIFSFGYIAAIFIIFKEDVVFHVYLFAFNSYDYHRWCFVEEKVDKRLSVSCYLSVFINLKKGSFAEGGSRPLGTAMSGHNKWSKIKHKKAITDAKKSKIFARLVRLIQAEAKKADGDKNAPGLRMAIEKARKENMPNNNVERAIKKANEASDVTPAMFEAYGPEGVGILITALTDNNNRTSTEIKHALLRQAPRLSTHF